MSLSGRTQHFILTVVILTALVLWSVSTSYARQVTAVPFSSDKWAFEGDQVDHVVYKGIEAIRLQGAGAFLDDVQFRTGTIEFDMAFPLRRGFHGVRFRMQGRTTSENLYFRSHLSGMPDANQYQPVLSGSASWQLYHGERYSSPTVYEDMEWMHVRFVIGDRAGELYLDSPRPDLTFPLLATENGGGLSVYASDLNPVYFANFTYHPGSAQLKGEPVPPAPPPPGSVGRLQVSPPLSEEQFTGQEVLDPALMADTDWTQLESSEGGIVNLAHALNDREGDVIMARLTLISGSGTDVLMRFGYSDQLSLYLNDRLTYAGDNSYRSRDYRFLGTIGLFDGLLLPLQDGENELVFVIRESFGGWGVMVQFPELEGPVKGPIIRIE